MILNEKFKKIIDMVFVDAKQILYQGNKLSPMIILTKNEEVFPVVVRDGKRTQEEINTMIGKAILVAKEADADGAVTIMEGYGLSDQDIEFYDQVIEKYSSIAKYPKRIEIMCVVIETKEGQWYGSSEIITSRADKSRSFNPVTLSEKNDKKIVFVPILQTTLSKVLN